MQYFGGEFKYRFGRTIFASEQPDRLPTFCIYCVANVIFDIEFTSRSGLFSVIRSFSSDKSSLFEFLADAHRDHHMQPSALVVAMPPDGSVSVVCSDDPFAASRAGNLPDGAVWIKFMSKKGASMALINLGMSLNDPVLIPIYTAGDEIQAKSNAESIQSLNHPGKQRASSATAAARGPVPASAPPNVEFAAVPTTPSEFGPLNNQYKKNYDVNMSEMIQLESIERATTSYKEQGKADDSVSSPMSLNLSTVKLNFDKAGKATGVQSGVEFDISGGFPCKGSENVVHFVTLKKMRTNVWTFGAAFFEYYVGLMAIDEDKIPFFLKNVHEVPIRDHSTGQYSRTKKGWTNNRIVFVLKFPINGFGLMTQYTAMMNTLKSMFSSSNEIRIGQIYADYLASEKESAYAYETGSSASAKKKKTHDELVDEMDTKLTSVFSKHIDEFNQPLDKYFTDWYIKDFLEKYCGYASFADIPDNLKKAAFRYWPRVPLPEWDDIVKEEF